MQPFARIKKGLRGNVPLTAVAMELVRKARVRAQHHRERAEMETIDAAPARLTAEFTRLSPEDLLAHFRERQNPRLWAIEVEAIQRREFPAETDELIEAAERIAGHDGWEVGGFGEIEFDGPNYWRCDPLTGADWGLDYHADVPIYTPAGPDIRVLWELNRFGQVLLLARAFAITGDERFAETCFRQLEEWSDQNPYARGANWRSPMDVIMRAVNIVAAFELVKTAACCTPERLTLVLKIADTHCRFTVDNSEFSHIATGNHYITNVAGLFVVATLLPELEHSAEWGEFGLTELLRECAKQILPDGVDWESSTGYHKFVTEMLMVCLMLAEQNGIDVAEEHKLRCRKMLEYLHAVIRPDGGMPLVGDCDGSQFLPIVRRDAEDAKYLLDMAAVLCKDAEFKIGRECSPEVLWLFGSEGVERYTQMAVSQVESSEFPNAGTYILRHKDLYVMLNANDIGLNGRGSHSHNDALSIEVSALGLAWIVDPGSYVYNCDREARHRFRSTAEHSTLVFNGREQNKIDVDEPFVSSNDSRPKLIDWKVTSSDSDTLTCEHYGYSPLVHRRTASLNHDQKFFSITDALIGDAHRTVYVSFHLAPGVEIDEGDTMIARFGTAAFAFVTDIRAVPEILEAGFSRHYGKDEASKIIRWRVDDPGPNFTSTFHLVPVAAGEDIDTRLAAVRQLTQNRA
jgi:hypothetical protein